MAALPLSSPSAGHPFRPTDEELVDHYLRNKINGNENAVNGIQEVDLRKEPWDLAVWGCPDPHREKDLSPTFKTLSTNGQITMVNHSGCQNLPAGYQFGPTDEELVEYYLKNKINGNEDAVNCIREVDLCKKEPWDLAAMSLIKTNDDEWIFFCPIHHKYINENRWNRATAEGYWKATGKDRRIMAVKGTTVIGTKRTLVFYTGRAPKGQRTDWVIHQYRATSKELDITKPGQGSFVLCKLVKKCIKKLDVLQYENVGGSIFEELEQNVWRRPDPHQEKDLSPTFKTLSTIGQITMVNDMGCQNLEPNELLPDSFDDLNFGIRENGSLEEIEKNPTFHDSFSGDCCDADIVFSSQYDKTEAAGGSFKLAFQLEGLTTQFTANPNLNTLVFPQSQIASAKVLSENMVSSEDWIALTQILNEDMGSSEDSMASQQEPFLEGHVYGSVNSTVPTCSGPSPSQQPIPTTPYTMRRIPQMMPPLTSSQNTSFVKLKATHRHTITEFQLPLTSGIIELKEEVAMRLKLEHDSFDVKYKDEELPCDKVLRNYVQLFSSLVNRVIRLLVVDKDPMGLNIVQLESLEQNRKRKYGTISVIVENHQQHQSTALPDGGEIVQLGSSVKKPLVDFDATTNRGFQSCVLVSYSKRRCMTLSSISGFYRTDSLTRKSFEVLETLLPLEQPTNSADTDQEKQIRTQMCEEPSDACGSHPIHMDTHIGRFRTYLGPSLCYSVRIRRIFREQPNDFVSLLSPRRLTFKDCVQLEKSPYLPGLLQIDAVEQGLTKSPRYLGGLTAQAVSSSRWPIGLPDGGNVVLLDPFDPLEQSTKNVAHAANADRCPPTVCPPKKKMVRKSIKTKWRTMSLVFEDHRQHFGRKCEGAAKSLGATRICMKHRINRVSTVNHILKPHGIHWWPFRQKWARRKGYSLGGERTFDVSSLSVDDILDSRLLFIHRPQFARSSPETLALPDGGKIVGPIALSSSELDATNNRAQHVRRDQSGSTTSHYEWKNTRETSRQGIAMSLCSVKDLKKHFGCKHKDVVKRLGVNIPMFKSTCRQHRIYWQRCRIKNKANRICEEHGISLVPTVKCIRRQHGFHRSPFRQGNFLGGERPAEVISVSTEEKLVSRLQFLQSLLGKSSLRPLSLPSGSECAGHIAFSPSEFTARNDRAPPSGQDQRGSSASCLEKERRRDTLYREGIASHVFRFEYHQQHYGSKHKNDAKILGVCLSTFKHISRHHGIRRWPNRIRNNVWRYLDPHREKNLSATFKMPSTNGLITMENDMGCQNLEQNELLPDSFEDLNFWSRENGSLAEIEKTPTFHDSFSGNCCDANICFSSEYDKTEAAGGSFKWAFQLEGLTTQQLSSLPIQISILWSVHSLK